MQEILSSAASFLPATVVAAIVLFVIREALEARRKRSERARKIRAIKLLLADEMEKNHWAFVSMFRVLTAIGDTLKEHPNAVFWLHTARNGSEHFRMKEEKSDEYDSGQAIPTFSTAMYEKLLPTLAELDKSLFETARTTYEEIIELAHYRETLTGFLAGESLAPEPEMTRHFLVHFPERHDEYFAALDTGYRALSGKELKSWRLR